MAKESQQEPPASEDKEGTAVEAGGPKPDILLHPIRSWSTNVPD